MVAAVKTVFDSAEEFTVKHPLNSPWTLWFDNPSNKRPSGNKWELNLKVIVEFDSVEDFWGVHKHANAPSTLPYGSNYHLFRTGIKPAWEDPKNSNGGKWTAVIIRSKREEILNEAWMNTMMNCTGECWDYSDQVCGTVCSLRKSNDRISIWLTTCDKEMCESIGRSFKLACGFGEKDLIKFESHPKEYILINPMLQRTLQAQ